MMHGLVRKICICAVLGVVHISFYMPSAFAESRMLTKDTKLHPQGWAVGDVVEFRKDTLITVNELGEVVSGTLENDTFLRPTGWDRIIGDYYQKTTYDGMGFFPHRYYHPYVERVYHTDIPGYGHLMYKSGTTVIFDAQGHVVTGTIKDGATVQLIKGKYGFITFKGGTVLTFYDSGAVRSGILEEDTYLRPLGWRSLPAELQSAGFLKFSAKKSVTFNENGEVVSGTLKDPAELRSEDGGIKAVKAGSVIHFNEAGEISIEAGETK
ncbi:hypothetical protein [Propionispora sp. 2/2-37]|uniref:hypothetical protein n=1 Tax=Propionispora sp. 2/2-37 TaxID=1677858 RepID=UPI00155DCAED|nr:hypothetical protein [Propionispora sp. 2/2-37]